MTKKASSRIRCCICGAGTVGAEDYIEIEVTCEENDSRQLFGAHRVHFNSVLAPGFETEIHVM